MLLLLAKLTKQPLMKAFIAPGKSRSTRKKKCNELLAELPPESKHLLHGLAGCADVRWSLKEVDEDVRCILAEHFSIGNKHLGTFFHNCCNVSQKKQSGQLGEISVPVPPEPLVQDLKAYKIQSPEEGLQLDLWFNDNIVKRTAFDPPQPLPSLPEKDLQPKASKVQTSPPLPVQIATPLSIKCKAPRPSPSAQLSASFTPLTPSPTVSFPFQSSPLSNDVCNKFVFDYDEDVVEFANRTLNIVTSPSLF